MFLNRRAAARYRVLASIIVGRERPEETTIRYKISLIQLITNLNVISYLSTCHTVYISVLILRALRTVFGPKRDEVTGEWRKLLNEDLSDLYSLPNIVRVVKSRRMRWVGHVARMGEGRGVHRVLVGKPEGKIPMGRPRRRWEDNIKMDLQELGGCVGTGWIWLRIGTGGGH